MGRELHCDMGTSKIPRCGVSPRSHRHGHLVLLYFSYNKLPASHPTPKAVLSELVIERNIIFQNDSYPAEEAGPVPSALAEVASGGFGRRAPGRHHVRLGLDERPTLAHPRLPVLYRAFRSAKRIVLLNILIRDLGPATLQDGIAAALAARYSLRNLLGAGLLAKNTRDNYPRIRATAQWYVALRRSSSEPPVLPPVLPPQLPQLPRLARKKLHRLVRAHRDVQFLIGRFEASRLPELRTIHPDAAYPLTSSERRRLAPALFRHQFLMRINCGTDDSHGAVYRQFPKLFVPWETHQLADAHRFVLGMIDQAFSNTTPGQSQPADRPVTGRVSLEAEIGEIACDLSAIRRKIKAGPEPGVSGTPRRGRWILQYTFLMGGPLPRMERSNPTLRQLRDELYQREDALPS
ncbi:hypothetical protein PG997_002817 [Apiospora hydei]|uniref:Uncharacterized protein n=1 Tax=Apiospora hydei TaxID=1337664 RepID=A0ABR1WXJ0_9PEZI